MNYKFKLLSAYVGIVVTVFLLLFVIYKNSQEGDVNNISNDKIEKKAKEQIKVIDEFVQMYVTSIKATSKDKFLLQYLQDNTKKSNLENLFLSLKKSLPCIFQIRYIDKLGNEKIKIAGTAVGFHKENALSYIVDEVYLLNEYKSEYFNSFVLLNKDEVGFSKINLNKENDIIQIPKIPTLRLGVKVYNGNNFEGVLVYNICLKQLFSNLSKTTLYNVSIVDNFGRYILHYDENNSMMGNNYAKYNLRDELPLNYNDVLQNESYKSLNYYSHPINIPNGQKLKLILQSKFSDLSSDIKQTQLQYFLFIILISIILIPIVLIFGNKEYYTRKLKDLTNIYGNHIITSATDLDGRITYVSHAFEKISGYNQKEIMGKKHSIIKGPNTPKSLHKEIWDTITKGKKWEGEIENRNKYGELYWLHTIIEPNYKNDKIIGYSAIARDITTEKYSDKLNTQINSLLQNVDEGILSFKLDRKIDKGYSKYCTTIFNMDSLDGELVNDILFGSLDKQNEIFLEAMKYINNTSSFEQRELYMSLFPKSIRINGKDIKLKYKFVDNSTIMLTAVDVTITNKLQYKIKKQKHIQDMIISIVKNKKEFLELKKEFEICMNSMNIENFNRSENLRKLHTFKGLFAQKGLSNTVKSIHELENYLKSDKFDITVLEEEMLLLELSFRGDIDIVLQVMGQDFFETVSEDFKDNQISIIQSKINFLLENNIVVDNGVLKNILDELLKLNVEPLYILLSSYPSLVGQLSAKLDKKVSPMKIEGEHSVLVPNEFKNFTKTLVHVYRNSLDHGIEDLESRILSNKEDFAKIRTSFKLDKNNIVLEISDDGRGLDVEQIRQRALEKNIVSQSELEELTSKDIISFIFDENFTTNKKANFISGRGIGLFVVKEELSKLGGTIEVENNYPNGCLFRFIIPNKIINNVDSEMDIIMYEAIKYLENSMDLQIDDILVSDAYVPIPELASINGIDISGTEESFCSIELDERLQKYISDIMIPDGAYSKDEMELMKSEIPKEMLNTYVGLSLNQFKKIGYEHISIGVPYELAMSIYIDMIEKSSQMKVVRIKTNYGDITCSLVKK